MLKTEVEECDLAFITAGLGGGTGTGSAHVVARLAKASEALTIAVVSYPFVSEGAVRRQNAEWGLERLRRSMRYCDSSSKRKTARSRGVRDLPLDAAFRLQMSSDEEHIWSL